MPDRPPAVSPQAGLATAPPTGAPEADPFDFDLPPERIAHEPARPRDGARLLQVGADSLDDNHVRDLADLLHPGDLLVANDTRVIPAQLAAYRGEVRIGITLDRPLPDDIAGETWRVLARNARRLRAGDTLRFGETLTATVMGEPQGGAVTLRFDRDGADLLAALVEIGALALPPYIDRPDGPTADDQGDYQTLFATHDGAVAAPTAGLHFTPGLRDQLQARGVGLSTVTLHVGAGTFLPVRGTLAEHRMHAERGVVSAETVEAIHRTHRAGGRVIAVGTTSLRVLETAARDGELKPWQGDTDLFILPGFRFHVADGLLTNFHLPRSTLFMLVCAFAGTQRMRAAYAHAIASGYRFYSYGDASLLARAAPELPALECA